MADSAQQDGSAKTAELVADNGRWHIFTCKKGGLEVGKTKKGKGTKIMVMSDASGIPVSAFTIEANVAELHCIETLLEMNQSSRQIRHLIYDKAADADWLRDQLGSRNIELVTPHWSNRKRPPWQDRRKLRRYPSRWVIEQTMS